MNSVLKSLASSASWLDAPAETIRTALSPLLGEDAPRSMKDALYGVWLGHPLHPLMTDISIGGWTMSMICDVLGQEEAADTTLMIGTISGVGTALTGAAQWFDTTNEEAPRRMGALHAMLNGTALGFYTAACILRENDARAAGIATAWTGHILSTTSAWIGGHLSYELGIGVNRDTVRFGVEEWADAIAVDDLSDGKPHRVEIDEVPVMILKDGDEMLATSPVCAHLAGPLDEGEIENGCVTCPWHGSVYNLHTGEVVHGPATGPIRVYDTRIEGDTVQVRARS